MKAQRRDEPGRRREAHVVRAQAVVEGLGGQPHHAAGARREGRALLVAAPSCCGRAPRRRAARRSCTGAGSR